MKDSLHYRLRACHLSCQKMIVQDLKNETDLKPGEPKILEFLAEHEPLVIYIGNGRTVEAASTRSGICSHGVNYANAVWATRLLS